MSKRSDERARFLGDIISTAVEGGTNYWAQVSQYQYVDYFTGEVRTVVGETVGADARAVLHPLNDDETGYVQDGRTVTLDDVARALGMIRGDTPLHLNVRIRARIMAADRASDAGDLDADDADVIVQVAILGDVIYG